MGRRIALTLLLLLTPGVLVAQGVAPFIAPADRILKVRVELRLDTTQMLKLRDLGRAQGSVLARAISNYLRAEADLLDASRGSDAGARKAALEKRSRAAIDGEMIRLAAEKEARAVLTARQASLLDIVAAESDDAMVRARPIWESQVEPLVLNAIPLSAPDSGTLRVAVEPLTTEIFIGDRSAGYGRVQLRLPLGNHTLKFRSPRCTDTLVVALEKGPQSAVTHRMSCVR
jgi:hypothetical protein